MKVIDAMLVLVLYTGHESIILLNMHIHYHAQKRKCFHIGSSSVIFTDIQGEK